MKECHELDRMFAYILSLFHILRSHTQSSQAAPAHGQADTQEKPPESSQHTSRSPSSASKGLQVENDQRKVRVMHGENGGWRLAEII